MKKVTNLAYICIVGLYLGFSISAEAQALTGDSWAQIQSEKKGSLVITYYQEETFAYTDGEGNHTGVELDILNQFVNYLQNAKGVELSIEWKPETNFVTFYNSVKNGNGGVIGAGNVTITDKRKEEIGFSLPYINNIAVLITHSSVNELTSLSDLSSSFEDFTAIIHKGTTHQTRIEELIKQQYPSIKVKYVSTDEEAVSFIEDNPKSFTYVDLAIYWLARQQNRSIKRHAIGDDTSEQFGFILPLESDWKPVFDEFFSLGSGYRSNLAYRRILMKHLGSEVTKMLEMAQAQKNR